MNKLIFLVALCMASHLPAQVTAASCSSSDVQTAINTATEGQTVTIPACASGVTWTSGVTISGKGVNVQGAGSGRIIAYDNGVETPTVGTGTQIFTLAGFSPGFSGSSFVTGETLRLFVNNNQTNYMQGTVTSWVSGTSALTMNITSTGGSGSYTRWLVSTMPSTVLIDNSSSFMWSITEDSSFDTSLSGMQIIEGTNTASEIVLNYNASGVPVLFHANWFQSNSLAEVIDSTTNRGVVWNNSFSGSTGNNGQLTTTAMVRIKGAPNTWTSTAAWGTSQGLYVETNDFHALQQSADNDDNGVMVWRYNLMDHAEFGTHGADTSNVGQRRFEYYENTGVFYAYSNGTTMNMPNGWVGLVRGGTYVMFDNTLPEVTSQDYGIKPDVAMLAINLQRNAGPNPCWGAGFTSAGQYYWAPRQVGMGNVTGTGHTNYPPDGCTNCTDDSITYVGDSEPAYIWGNSRQPLTNVEVSDYGLGQTGSCPSSPTPDSSVNYIVSGRDFFNGSTAKPGYTPYVYPNPLTASSVQQYLTSGGKIKMGGKYTIR